MMRIDSGWVHQSRFFLVVVIALIAGAIRVDAQTGCAGVANDPEGSSTWIPKFCQEFNDPTSRAPADRAVWTYDLDGGGCGNHEVEIYCGPAGDPRITVYTFTESNPGDARMRKPTQTFQSR